MRSRMPPLPLRQRVTPREFWKQSKLTQPSSGQLRVARAPHLHRIHGRPPNRLVSQRRRDARRTGRWAITPARGSRRKRATTRGRLPSASAKSNWIARTRRGCATQRRAPPLPWLTWPGCTRSSTKPRGPARAPRAPSCARLCGAQALRGPSPQEPPQPGARSLRRSDTRSSPGFYDAARGPRPLYSLLAPARWQCRAHTQSPTRGVENDAAERDDESASFTPSVPRSVRRGDD